MGALAIKETQFPLQRIWHKRVLAVEAQVDMQA
jgi:hypothetical protein